MVVVFGDDGTFGRLVPRLLSLPLDLAVESSLLLAGCLRLNGGELEMVGVVGVDDEVEAGRRLDVCPTVVFDSLAFTGFDEL